MCGTVGVAGFVGSSKELKAQQLLCFLSPSLSTKESFALVGFTGTYTHSKFNPSNCRMLIILRLGTSEGAYHM